MTTSDQYATPADIADARPDLSLETVRRLCRQGRIPGAVLVGRTWQIPADKAEEFVSGYRRYRPAAAETSPAPDVDTSGAGSVVPFRPRRGKTR